MSNTRTFYLSNKQEDKKIETFINKEQHIYIGLYDEDFNVNYITLDYNTAAEFVDDIQYQLEELLERKHYDYKQKILSEEPAEYWERKKEEFWQRNMDKFLDEMSEDKGGGNE